MIPSFIVKFEIHNCSYKFSDTVKTEVLCLHQQHMNSTHEIIYFPVFFLFIHS